MQKILIIGAGGYVGNCLCPILLNYDYKVRAVDNFYKGHCDELITLSTHPNFEFMYGNICKEDDCKKMLQGIDGILNLSGVVGFPASDKDPVNALHINAYAIDTLLKVRNSISREIPFITCSTDSVFGIVQEDCNEETTPNPQTHYGQTKLMGEKIALSHNNTIALRFSTGCGVSPRMRCNLLVNDLVYQALSNKSLTVFESKANRAFINVFDMARSLMFFLELLANKKNKYNLYCVGSDGMNYSKGELAELIKTRTNCHVIYHDYDKDPDVRNYKPTHQRLHEEGFSCKFNMNDTIDSLIKVYTLLSFQKKYQ